jgi:hypothetical protein
MHTDVNDGFVKREKIEHSHICPLLKKPYERQSFFYFLLGHRGVSECSKHGIRNCALTSVVIYLDE